MVFLLCAALVSSSETFLLSCRLLMPIPYPIFVMDCTAKPGDFALLGIPVKTSLFIKLLHLAVGCYVMSVNQEHLKHYSNCLMLLHG